MNYSVTTRCPCGSGLRELRCCALDQSSLAPAERSRHLLPLVDEAFALNAQGDLAQAEKLCLEVLELEPSQGGALAVLYQIRKAQGMSVAAEVLVRRMVTFNPNNIWATQELTLVLFGKRDLAD